MSRPTRTWLDEQPGPIEIDQTRLDDKGRLTVCLPGRGLVMWLSKEGTGAAAVELAEPGRLVLRSWGGFGERLVERQRELAASLPDVGAETELIALRERFLWNKFESGGRLLLSERELDHLDVGEDEDFLVVTASAKIEIWNRRYRDAFRVLAARSLQHIAMDPDY